MTKPAPPHLKRGLYKKPPSPPSPTLKPSYSQIVKIPLYDPEKQAYDLGKLSYDQSHDPSVLSRSHDLSCDLALTRHDHVVKHGHKTIHTLDMPLVY